MRRSAAAAAVLILVLPGLALPFWPTALGAPPSLETLRNPSLEGTAGTSNGFVLRHDGAQKSVVARSGLESVDLARGGGLPNASLVLGRVDAYPTHAVPLGQVTGLVAHHRMTRQPPVDVHLEILLTFDANGDGAEDRCLVHALPGPLAAAPSWVAASLGLSATVEDADPSCGSGAPRTLGDVVADPAYAGAAVIALGVRTRAATGAAWEAGFPVLVDDLSLLATSSPLVRIREAGLNLCGGASFATLHDALACAAEGATILVSPGTYDGGLVVDKSVTLCSASLGATACGGVAVSGGTLIQGGGSVVVRLQAEGAVLDGFTLQNPALAAVDAPGAPADVALVSVEADGVKIANSTLRRAAAALAPGQTRMATSAIRVADGSDGVEIRGSRVEEMPASRLGDAACPAAPCRTFGVRHLGGALLVLADNRIDLTGAGHSDAVNLAGAANATLTGNVLTYPPSTAPLVSAGIRGSGVLAGLVMTDNQLLSGGAGLASVGLRAHLEDATLTRNAFRDNARGLDLLPGVRVALAANSFSGTGDAIALGPGSGAVTLRENAMRVTGAAATLRLLPGVSNLAVDARENDWGVYSAAAIRATLRDEGAGNAIDITCYVDQDGATRVCPPVADFTFDPNPPLWRQNVTFLDQSLPLGRPIASVTWNFGDDAAATGASHTRNFTTPGSMNATLTVTDQDGFTATLTRSFAVVNTAPQILPVGSRVVDEDTLLAFRVAVTDAEGDAIILDAPSLPGNATFNASDGRFSWRPGFDAAGVHLVSFRATDGHLTDWENLTITVGDANAPPLITITGNLTGREAAPMTFDAHAVDPDGTPVNLSAYVLPSGATWTLLGDGRARFTWTPTHDHEGDHPLTVFAEDGVTFSRHDLVLRVNNTNRPPVVGVIPPRTVAEGATLQFIVTATDPDGSQRLVLSSPNLPSGATFHPRTGVFTWTPHYEMAGNFTIEFVASDGDLTGHRNATIRVTHTNRAPDVSPFFDQTAKAARLVRFPIFSVDPDGDPLAFRVEPPMPGVDLSHGIFRWVPPPGMVGVHRLFVVGSDGKLEDWSPVTITVLENEAPTAAIAPPAHVDVDAAALFRASGDDPDSDRAVAFAWDFDDRDGFQVEATGEEVSHVFTRIGRHVVTLRASDADGIPTWKTVDVIVDDAIRVIVLVSGVSSPTTHAMAYVYVKDWQGKPHGPAVLEGATYYQPYADTPPIPMRTFTAQVDASGETVFLIPKDLVYFDVPGRHVLTLTARTPTSYLGDAETTTVTQAYASWL